MSETAVNLAIESLRRSGHSVEPADIPGLWNVSGYPELTTAQLLAVSPPIRLADGNEISISMGTLAVDWIRRELGAPIVT